MPLSGNTLKIIAAIAMLCDHIGAILFPKILLFRYIGRIAFPIFAYFIAEGCRYTRNRLRYLLTIATMATLFQIVYFIVVGDTYMSIFVTFTLSILLIYLFDDFKRRLLCPKSKLWQTLLAAMAFLLIFIGVYLVNTLPSIKALFLIDYGFYGCVTPLFAALLHERAGMPPALARLDTTFTSTALMAIPLTGLLFLAEIPGQAFSFLALPLLWLYNGERGKYKMKYFFYIFYPAHLVVLYGIYYLLYFL